MKYTIDFGVGLWLELEYIGCVLIGKFFEKFVEVTQHAMVTLTICLVKKEKRQLGAQGISRLRRFVNWPHSKLRVVM